MNSELARKLQRLGQRQCNRIWLNRVLRRAAPLFVYSALVFFLAGGIHQLLLPLNFALIAGIAMVPSLVFVCFLGITQKPQPREGAAEADKLFAANSLFVSAWELTHSQFDNVQSDSFQSDIRGTANLLLERCEKALPGWSRALTQPAHRKLKPVGMVTVSLAVLGLFFMSQTSHVQSRQTSQTSANSSLELSNADGDSDGAVVQKILSELSATDSHPTTQTPLPSAASTTPVDRSADTAARGSKQPGQPAQIDTAASTPAAVNPLPASDPTMTIARTSPASNPNGDEKTTEHSAGNEAADAPDSSVIEAKEYDRVRLVDIETGFDQRSIASDETAQGSKLIEPEQTGLRQSAGNPWQQVSANGFTYMLSPQQRNLVWRYFVQLDKIDDP